MNFITPQQRNKPIITANKVEIKPNDLSVKVKKSNRIAPEIGYRNKQ